MAKPKTIHACRAGLQEVQQHVRAGRFSDALHNEIADVCAEWMKLIEAPTPKTPKKE